MSSKGREIYVYYQVSQALGRKVIVGERWVIVGSGQSLACVLGDHSGRR